MGNEERIVNVLIVPWEDEHGEVHDQLTVFGKLKSGENIPLFNYNGEMLSYDPVTFIGMTPEEAKEEKRLLDLIYFGTVLD